MIDALCSLPSQLPAALARTLGNSNRLEWRSNVLPPCLHSSPSVQPCDQMDQIRPSHVKNTGCKPRSRTQEEATPSFLRHASLKRDLQERATPSVRAIGQYRPFFPIFTAVISSCVGVDLMQVLVSVLEWLEPNLGLVSNHEVYK